MKVLITGSGGFVGNFLVSFLTSLNIEVIGIDNIHYKFQKYNNYIFELCDITDAKKVDSIVKKHNPTHVIHLAYVMVPKHNRELEDNIDVQGSKNIFISSNNCKSVKQFIIFSSASVYGGNKENQLWITEDGELKPNEWVYAQNKIKVEDFYNTYPNRDNLKVVIFRMCTACGPSYYKSKGLVKLLNRSPIGLLVNGTDMDMQFIYEDDVKTIVKLVLDDPEVEGVFNLAPDSYATTKELSPNPKLFIKISESKVKKIFNFLWKSRIAKISPTSVSLITYGIIISSKKLMDRYNYKYKYTTKEAFYSSI